MKKFFKFVLGTISLATLACGAYYFIKKFVCKDSNNEFDDLDDNYDDYEAEDENTANADGREYVSINITSENTEDSDVVAPVEESKEPTEEVKADQNIDSTKDNKSQDAVSL